MFDWGIDDAGYDSTGGAFRDPFGERAVMSDREMTDSDCVGMGMVMGMGEDLVGWPALVRVMDGEGRRVRHGLTKKKFLSEVL